MFLLLFIIQFTYFISKACVTSSNTTIYFSIKNDKDKLKIVLELYCL